jgi:hypothetical protein
MHLYIILDILRFNMNKHEFDLSVQVDNQMKNEEIGVKYMETFNELIHHLFMIHDLVNLCKVLTSFKYVFLFGVKMLFSALNFCVF